VYQVPIANFSVNNVCDSLPANFVNLSSISAGSFLNIWKFGDGNSSPSTNPSYTYSTFGTYSVELISTSAFGCADTVIGSVTIYPRPKPNFGIPAVCEGSVSFFSDSSSIDSGFILSYAWDFGDGTNSIIKNPTKQYLMSGVYPVTLMVNSDKGCSYDTTINASVNVLPIADFSFISECNGDSISFVNLSSISSGIINYNWSFGDGETSTEISPKHLFPLSGSFPTKLLVSSNDGCSDSITKLITVFPIPNPNAGNDTSVSKGYSAQLSASGGNNYFWFPASGLSSSTISNPKANPMVSTKYILTVIDVNGCIGYDTVNVNIVDDYKLVANNVITPNGDGANDVWKIENISTFSDAELMIFDRWGKMIYNVTGYDNSWGGTSGTDILPDGTYYYVITFPTSSIVYKGSITLLRDK
ncbi:MAG: PKD domain-containing protein, partial [Bacteroidota bacterium]